jgi:TetR/AcrR family transcriptional regulator
MRLMLNERPLQHRMSATDRQRQLLTTALNIFSRKGFKGATTKEIAAAAGVTEAIIFQHFPSKEALYSAVLELNLDTGDEQKWSEEIFDCMERKDDEGLIQSFMLHILQAYRRNTALQRVILFAALEGHEQGLTRLHRQFSPIFEKLKEYICLRQQEGAMIDVDPYAILITFGGVAHQYGLITQIMHAPAPDISDEAIAQQFAQLVMNGVQKSSAKEIVKSEVQKPC